MSQEIRPLISIITVCYNAGDTIERTLRSVSAQTYQNIEYIVIDGGSSDSTLELIAHLAPQALVWSEPDRGIYDAMNKGLRHATGDYIWYLNAGDALAHPTIVADLVESACEKSWDEWPDVIYGDTRLIDRDGRDLGPRQLRPPKRLDWRSFRHGMLVCHQSFVAKRSLAPAYDLRYRFSADVDWCIRLMKQAHRYHQITKPLSLYLNEGTTTANHRASLWERFEIMCRHYGFLPTLIRHIGFALRQLQARPN